jgi:2'-hydroxyisoflavone reductase
VDAHYGALKAACETVVQDVLGDRALVVRPGLIVGPHDPTGRFTYWPVRLARGGEVLAPKPASASTQVIDVRDLAAWMLELLDRGLGGTFNATGPTTPFAGLLEACRPEGGPETTLTWVDPGFLLDAGVTPWTELPLWLPGEQHAGLGETRIDRALAAGLTLRPLAETARDTLAWARTLAVDPPRQQDGRYRVRTLTPERERELLAAWHAR